MAIKKRKSIKIETGQGTDFSRDQENKLCLTKIGRFVSEI